MPLMRDGRPVGAEGKPPGGSTTSTWTSAARGPIRNRPPGAPSDTRGSTRGGGMTLDRTLRIRAGVLALAGGGAHAADGPEGWETLFNGTDLTGWKVRHDKYTVMKFVDDAGKEIKGARRARVDQKETVVDAKNKPIEGA